MDCWNHLRKNTIFTKTQKHKVFVMLLRVESCYLGSFLVSTSDHVFVTLLGWFLSTFESILGSFLFVVRRFFRFEASSMHKTDISRITAKTFYVFMLAAVSVSVDFAIF